jgi:hypothetical protein
MQKYDKKTQQLIQAAQAVLEAYLNGDRNALSKLIDKLNAALAAMGD